MPGLLEQSGAPPQKQPKYVPVFVDRHFTGLYTQRNPLHDPSDVITAKYYGGRPDALWMGNNVELTNRLTLQRRPGLTAFSSAVYPTAPDNTFSFQLSDGTIRVIVDTGTTGLLPLTSVANASNGTTVYTGTFPIGGSSSISVPIVNTTTIAPPAAPTISGSAGTINFGTAFVKVTYLNAAGETLASAESSTLVSYHPAGHNPTNPTVTVNSPISVPGATSYNVYISMSTGTETLQNSVPVPLGSQYSLNLFNLVSGAPVPGSNTTTTAPPASASLSSVAGGSLAGTTYFVKITYVTAAGETTGSVESSLAVAANHLLVVSSPTTSPGVTGYNVYVSTTTNTELLQTAPPIAIGTNWTEPFAGLAGPSSATYTGMVFSISGFVNGQNNGTFLCVGSTGTTLTLANTAGIAETRNATAISSGAVYWDQQQNGLKTLLFGKSPGAGQTLFQAVAGILYAGDGVDTWKYTPLNPNLPPGSAVSVWNWGIVAPTQQPSVSIVASGAASTVWQANTIFSTMGLTVDMFGQDLKFI